jgi:hypothetical protein
MHMHTNNTTSQALHVLQIHVAVHELLTVRTLHCFTLLFLPLPLCACSWRTHAPHCSRRQRTPPAPCWQWPPGSP